MVSNLHLDILPKRQKLLFETFSKLGWISNFYLAGGTALALQIGHRRSIDFDFFSEQEFDVRFVRKKLVALGDYEVYADSEQIIDGALNSVRTSFFNLPYPLINLEVRSGNLRIASKEDIAAMKLSAISTRGSRKDFIDLFFLLTEFSFEEIVRFYEKKYGKNGENVYCVLKGLVYFVDAEQKPMPNLLIDVAWREVKKRMVQEHKAYLGKLKA